MRSRRLILGLVSWLVVVAVSSTVAWAVISRAGDNLISSGEPVIVTKTEGTGPSSKSTAGTSEPSATPTVTATQPDAQTPAPTEPAPSFSSSSPSSASSSSNPSSSSAASPTRSTEPARQTQRRTWQGTGGRLVVACDGSRISLVAAQPDAGFKVGVGREGFIGLEVEFEGKEDQDGEGSHLKATCLSGIPDFDVENHGDENDEHD